MIEARPLPTDTKLEILPERDPRLATGKHRQRQRLAHLSPDQRAALVLERYPQLRALPNCDWQRLSVRATFSILYGESSRHFARLELATLAIVLASAGISVQYAVEVDSCARSILTRCSTASGITTSQEITLEVWEAWGRDTTSADADDAPAVECAAAATITGRLPRTAEPRGSGPHWPPAAATAEAVSVPPCPRQNKVAAQRKRKAKTDVVSECATAILALMLALSIDGPLRPLVPPTA
jgi:hypothetical protein